MKLMNENLGKKQNGQIVIVLLLIMLVALSIGLAVTQRSVLNLTTSNQAEQSSRALSAAEAGIEKLIQNPANPVEYDLGNQSVAKAKSLGLLPPLPPAPESAFGIEYPPVNKETIATFWLVDNPINPTTYYGSDRFSIYFGNKDAVTDKPAIEVTIIYKVGNNFLANKVYLDSDSPRASTKNRFDQFNTLYGLYCDPNNSPKITTILTENSEFYCKTNNPIVFDNPATAGVDACSSPGCIPYLIRIRLLYANLDHKVAVIPYSTAVFPPQIEIYTSTGQAGQSERKIQVFRQANTVPPWLDFSLFSINDIRK